MLAKVNSAALYGIDALRVEVEIDLASGLPQLATVGLPEGAVKESIPSQVGEIQGRFSVLRLAGGMSDAYRDLSQAERDPP